MAHFWQFSKFLCPGDKMRNGPYLGSGAKNNKNKTTFSFGTLKVREKKAPMWPFTQFYVQGTILAQGPELTKVRPLSFLKLLKL